MDQELLKEITTIKEKEKSRSSILLPFKPRTKKDLDTKNELQALTVEALTLCSKKEARELIPYDTALSFKILPILIKKKSGQKGLVFASRSEFDQDQERLIKFISGVDFTERINIEHEMLEDLIYKAYNFDGQKIVTNSKKLKLISSLKVEDKEKHKEFNTLRESKAPIPQFLNSLLDYAISREASDLHIVPLKNGTTISMRVKGSFLTHRDPVINTNFHQQLLSRIKILSNLDIAKKGIQEGRFKIDLPNSEIYARVAIMPSLHGEKVVIRFPTTRSILKIEELGFDPEVLSALLNSLQKSTGLILFSGATGSGKTTSLYASLNYLKNSNKNIVTLEDPIEAEIPGIVQTQIDQKIGLDYGNGLKAVLRHDPNVIMLGEIRDEKSAREVTQAVLTGHLVFSTVHGGTPLEGLERLSKLGVDNSEIPYLLSLILTQELLNKLCVKCKVLDLENSNKYECKIYQAVGCSACEYTGYEKRIVCCSGLAGTNEFQEVMQSYKGSLLKLESILSARSYYRARDAKLSLLKRGEIDVRQCLFSS